MKTYGFTMVSGWIGGSGVVVAKNKKEALLLANRVIENEGIQGKPITEDELIEIDKNTAILLTDGNY